jgi:uncharacterized protein (TIGR02646 family)
VDWGAEFAQRLAANVNYCFAWKQWQGLRVNQRLLPLLSKMTDSHCAYCDWFPMDTGTDPTIDHFKPKARFPQEAYCWENLYLCCRHCQEKTDDLYTDQLLRPDEIDYRFESFFIYNYIDGTLSPNPDASVINRERARLTVEILKLNSRGRPAARKRELDRFRDLAATERSKWIPSSPFRYLLWDEIL